MKCLIALVLLAYCCCLIWTGTSIVGASENITVIAHGSDNIAAPGAPVDFDAVLVSDNQVDITWAKGEYAVNTVIRGKLGEYPADYTDGYAVYDGPGTAVTDWVDLLMVDEALYYRAWSWNAIGYSGAYAQDFVEGGAVGMVNALMLFPLVGLLAALTFFGDWRRNWPAIIIATLGWFLLAGWAMYLSRADFDGYFILALISIGLALITCIWPLVEKPGKAAVEEQDEDEKTLAEMRSGRHSRKARGIDE